LPRRSTYEERKEERLEETYEGARQNAFIARTSKELLDEVGVYGDADRDAKKDMMRGDLQAKKALSDLPDEYEPGSDERENDILTEEGLEQELEDSRELLRELEEEHG